MLIDDLKWVSKPNEIIALIQENFPERVLTDEYFQEYKNLQVAYIGGKEKILVKFDKSEKVTIICEFSEVSGLFTGDL